MNSWWYSWHFLKLHTFCGKHQSQQRARRKLNQSPVFSDESHSSIFVEGMQFLLQFNSKTAHIAGSVDTAADFLSHLELVVTEKIRLKVREDVQTTPIEVTTPSSEIADEEQFFFTQSVGEMRLKSDPPTNRTIAEKATEWVANKKPFSMKPSIKDFTKVDRNTTSYSILWINVNARIRVEQDVELVSKT